MRTRRLPADYGSSLVQGRDIFQNLLTCGMDASLIRKAIHNMPAPPYECHEVFFVVPHIERIKEENPEEYAALLAARKALSHLLNSPIMNVGEKELLKEIQKRIIVDYQIELTDRRALLDAFRSEEAINRLEDFADFPDEGSVWLIDSDINTEQQGEGKLVTMLYNYMRRFADDFNERMPIGHERDYNQKDILELIAEILNLRWYNRFNYEKIRTLYRNFRSI